MAGRDVQALFLQVDASVELLRREMTLGERAVDGFGSKVEGRLAKVQSSIDQLNFGDIEKRAEVAAKQVSASFTAGFNDIEKLAAKAIEAPPVKGGISIGASDARAAAAAAQQQAVAYSLITAAAERAAVAEGSLSGETQAFLLKARAATREAELQAAALLREAGALERLEIELRSSQSAQQLFQGQQHNLVVSAGQQRQGVLQLGEQFRQFATEVSLGINPIVAFTQQSGQAAFALTNFGGTLGKLGAFMAGPFGTLALIAVSVLGSFAVEALKANSAIDDAVDKLRKDAEQTEATRRAKELFVKTEEGVAAAIRDGTEATRKAIEAEKGAEQAAYDSARAYLAKEIALRKATAASLAQALAEEDQNNLQSRINPEGGAIGKSISDQRISDLQKQLQQNDALLAQAESRVSRSAAELTAKDAKRDADPIARINKLYDDRTAALVDAAGAQRNLTEAAKAHLKVQLDAVEAARKVAIAAEQERLSAERSTRNGANRQSGREISIAQATAIVQSVGGTVTSGRRSYAEQARLYALYKAGKGSLAAPPGTSDHESGQAVDVRKTAGLTLGRLAKAFEDAGVRVTQKLDEGDHFHIGFGKQGPSQETVAKRAEAARQKVLDEDTSFTEEERRARHQLLDATRKTAGSEAQRDVLIREDINAEADANARKIGNDLAAEKIKPAQAEQLLQLNEATAQQRLRNVTIARLAAQSADDLTVAQSSRETNIDVLQAQLAFATTADKRREIELQILNIKYDERAAALEAVIASRDATDAQKAIARDQLGALPATKAGDTEDVKKRTSGTYEPYLDRLKEAASNTKGALDDVKVDALKGLEDGLVGLVTGTETVASAFKKMAASIIADLARIAIEKLLVKVISGGLFADGIVPGAATGLVPGFAAGLDGNVIRGAGSGRSDSILALLGDNLIRVSNGESIMTEAATRRYGPALKAMNANRLPSFADGMIGDTLRLPGLPGFARFRTPSPQAPIIYDLRGAVLTQDLLQQMNQISARHATVSIVAGSQLAQSDIADRQAQAIP